MVTPKKKLPTKSATSTSTTKAKKSKLSEVESIAKSISGISLSTADVFSVKCIDPIFRRKLVPVEEYGLVKDYTEVDIKIGQPIPEDYISVALSSDGRRITYHKATHEMFGEADRMKMDMGSKYRPDNPRVLAHDDTCQMIRATCKAKDGKFWPADEDMQIIELHEKCRGMVMKKFQVYPTKFRIKNQTQYVMIMTLRVELENQRIRREKKGKLEIHDDGEVADEEDDFGEVEYVRESENGSEMS